MKNKLFLLVPTFNFGGQERVVSRMSYILKNKYDCYLILYNNKDIFYSFNGEIINFNVDTSNVKSVVKKIIININMILKLRKLFKKHKPIASISFGREATRLNYLARVKGIQIISSIRGFSTIEYIKENGFRHYLTRKSFGKSDKIICVSKLIKKASIDLFPRKFNKIYTLYNPYDIEEILQLTEEPIEFDFEYVVALGTLKKEKGYWHLLKAFKLVHEKKANLKLVIIGPDLDGTLDNLLKLRSLLNLDDHIVFHGLQKNPYKYLYRAKLYVMSSISEGFPNALVEAMACRLPIISTNCPSGPFEILSEGNDNGQINGINYSNYGILVPVGSTEEKYDNTFEESEIIMAEAILSLLSNEKLRCKYSNLAFQRSLTYSYSTFARKFKEIIED